MGVYLVLPCKKENSLHSFLVLFIFLFFIPIKKKGDLEGGCVHSCSRDALDHMLDIENLTHEHL